MKPKGKDWVTAQSPNLSSLTFQSVRLKNGLKYKLEHDLLKKSYIKKESVVKR